MSTTKKFLSIILAILMIVSSVPIALAGGGGLTLTINMYDDEGDGWEGAKINIYTYEDGTYTEVGSATIDDGGEATYTNFIEYYDKIYVFTWSKGSSDEECFFKIKIDSETVSRASCSECGSFEQDEIIYSTLTCEEHADYENGKCVVCKYALPFEVTTGETVAYYSSFEDALNNAQDGSTVKLMRDYDDFNDHKTIDKAITIDLNGYTWEQPSLQTIDVFANVTFTDSFGGGYCNYGVRLYSPCTFIAGEYDYSIEINFETEDTLADYLGPCSEYYDYWTDELLDLSDATYYGSVKIVPKHTGGTQTCKGYKCDECYEWYGKADSTAHSFVGGICEFCSENNPATDSETETVTPDGTASGSDVCDVCGEEHASFFNDIICAIKKFFNMIIEFFKGLNS